MNDGGYNYLSCPNRTHKCLIVNSVDFSSAPQIQVKEGPRVYSRWVYCHLVMCFETCMSKPCSRPLWRGYAHFSRVITSEPAPRAEPERGHEPSSPGGMLTPPGRWMSLTLLSDHSRDLERGQKVFSCSQLPALPSRGSSSSLSAAQSSLQAPSHHHSHSAGQDRWIS